MTTTARICGSYWLYPASMKTDAYIVQGVSSTCPAKARLPVTAIIQVNLRQPAPPVKKCRIQLVQSFTARMPLLTATSAFGLGRIDAGVLLNSVIYVVSVPLHCGTGISQH